VKPGDVLVLDGGAPFFDLDAVHPTLTVKDIGPGQRVTVLVPGHGQHTTSRAWLDRNYKPLAR
jgi:hypothetical protein